MPCPKCSAPSMDGGNGLCGAHFKEQQAAIRNILGERARIGPKEKLGLLDAARALGGKADGLMRAASLRKAPTAAQKRGLFGRLYCSACGQVSDGQRHVPGSILIELVLWLCLLVPGICYSIWRHSAARKVCPTCKNAGLIPVTSPRARQELNLPL